MRKAMVLCAGLGTRLLPLTEHLPKPLMPVGDRSAFAHALRALRAAGVGRVAVNTHHRAELIERAVASLHDGDIALVREPHILGTAGGLCNAGAAIGEGDVLVYNGDIVAPDLDIGALYAAWEQQPKAAALWAVKPRPDAGGTVGLDAAGNVIRLRGQRFGTEVRSADFLAVQIVGGGLREKLPCEGCLVADVAIPLLAAGGSIATFAYEGPWHDIGDAAGLLEANLAWLGRSGRPAWLGPAASAAAGVALVSSLVGAGARVLGAGELRSCVVFPGATARAPLARALVSPEVTVAL